MYFMDKNLYNFKMKILKLIFYTNKQINSLIILILNYYLIYFIHFQILILKELLVLYEES